MTFTTDTIEKLKKQSNFKPLDIEGFDCVGVITLSTEGKSFDGLIAFKTNSPQVSFVSDLEELGMEKALEKLRKLYAAL